MTMQDRHPVWNQGWAGVGLRVRQDHLLEQVRKQADKLKLKGGNGTTTCRVERKLFH